MITWPDDALLAPNIHLKKCTLDDSETLRSIGRETYSDTFASMNTQENMDAYLNSAFSSEQIQSDLEKDSSAFYFLHYAGELAGYIKLNLPPTQSDINEPGTLEVERIYVTKKHQGLGLGKRLLATAELIATGMGCGAAWLGVWEKNGNAIGFYRRMGYTEVGRHSFRMGEEVQSDLIMKKNLDRKE